MNSSFVATSLLFAFATAGQSQDQPQIPITNELQDYSLEAKGLVDALVKISAHFQFPLGIEWIKSADTLAPISLSRGRTTLKEILQTVVAAYGGYDWRIEDGVVYVYQRELAKDVRNPLNVTVKAMTLTDTVAAVNNTLNQMVTHEVRFPELYGIAGSVLGYPGEPVFRFSVDNGPARKLLNQITSVPKPTAPSPVKLQRIWIATFPERPAYSRTGLLEVMPVWSRLPPLDQPFWILLGWGDTLPENMLK